MATRSLAVVTGAFGFSGKYITGKLLESGAAVRTLTNRPQPPEEFAGRVEVSPLDFSNPEGLASSLRGADVLFNTYWIRLERAGTTFEQAIRNSQTLIAAAKQAGVKRIVHISITNPSEDSRLPYFRGKAVVERAIRDSGLSQAILRPAVLFGHEGVLINNLAWFLRRLPVFVIPGSGDYGIRPIFVDDLAQLAVDRANESDNSVVDAVGPQSFTLNSLIDLIRRTVGSRALVLHLPPRIAALGVKGLGLLVRDVVMTPDELASLRQNRLTSDAPPAGPTRLSDWLSANAASIGRTYISDLGRRPKR